MDDESNPENVSGQNSKTSPVTGNATDLMVLTPGTTRMQFDNTSESDDEEQTLLVLDPDHPKMVQFQIALKKHLMKMKEKAELELREVDKPLRAERQDQEELGVQLYGVQQELARKQMLLESEQDKCTNMESVRHHEETELEASKNTHLKNVMNINECKARAAMLRRDVENMELHRYYMKSTKEDVSGDIKLLRRAAEKAGTEVSNAELEKKKQDLFVDRLVERVNKLQNDIAMYNAQQKLQAEETKNIKGILQEAELQLSTINFEKQQLHQHWTNSLIGMKRRDEAHTAALEALRQLQEQELFLSSDMNGYKTSILQEQQQNEKLTQILNKNDRDADIMKEMFNLTKQKYDVLKAEFTTYSRLLQETEQALSRSNSDKNGIQESLKDLQKYLEKERNEIKELENEIMDKIHHQLMFEKSSQYVNKLTGKTRGVGQQLESTKILIENQLSHILLELTSIRTRTKHVEEILKNYDDEIAKKNQIIDRSEAEIVRRAILVERKQTTIDGCNKKLELLISKAGGFELGPLESTLKSLQKSVNEVDKEISELQQQWLRKQSELVQLLKERQEQLEKMGDAKKELIIHSQKKMRTENKIQKQNCEQADLSRNITNCRNDIIKLNDLIHKEFRLAEYSEQSNILLENDFLSSLQDAKTELIELQEKLQNIKDDKEDLLQSIVETDQQIMLWERKIQLLRETRAAVDTDFDQGEIRTMKSEIHRMEVRYAQLIRAQNQMIQETEKFFLRRDCIAVHGEAKQNKKVLTKGTLNKLLNDTRKKIKQIQQETHQFTVELDNIRQSQNVCGEQLESLQESCETLKSCIDVSTEDIEKKTNQKYKNLSKLVSEQHRSKYYQQVKDNKYKMICKSKASWQAEFSKQSDQVQALMAITEQISQEFPGMQPYLERITQIVREQSHMYMNEDENLSARSAESQH